MRLLKPHILLPCTLALSACNLAQTPQLQPQNAPIALPGTQWQVVRLGGEPVTQTPPTITFSQQSRSHGFAGCNRFFAQYDTDGRRISISNIGSTRIACEQDRNQLEQQFLRGLQAVHQVRRATRNIQLLDSTGAVIAELEPLAGP